MGKLVVTEFITLDGVIGEPAWSFEFNRGDEGERFKGDELGTGKRLFGEGMPRTKLRLVGSKAVGADGVLILTYEPAR